MAKKETSTDNIVYHFVDVDIDQIWTYNKEKNPFGPISVETIYKNEPEVTKKTKKKKK